MASASAETTSAGIRRQQAESLEGTLASRQARGAGSAHLQGLRNDAVAALAAAAIASLLVVFVHPGPDTPAHVYRLALFRQDGLSLWTTQWYDGMYAFVNYSVLYYPLAALTGISRLAVISVAVGTAAGSNVLRRGWGPRAVPATVALAVTWPFIVLSSEYPFILASAFAALALVAFAHATDGTLDRSLGDRRSRWRKGLALTAFLLMALCSLAASALAFLALAAAVVVTIVRRRSWRRDWLVLAVVLVLGGAEALTMRMFSSAGLYPFPLSNFAEVTGFGILCLVLCRGVRELRLLADAAIALLVVTFVVFVVPSPVGANLSRIRFAAIVAVVLIATVRHWRPRALCAAGLAATVVWVASPTVDNFTRPFDEASSAFWQPAITFVHHHSAPDYRVEVVDTVEHWGSYYFPLAGIPLVRGWFRQADFPTNDLLYADGPLHPASYRQWLRSQGVDYVVLPNAPLDPSARSEARLLHSGRSGLVPVLSAPNETVYALPHPEPIVTGPKPARVLRAGVEAIVIRFRAPGQYRIAERWSPYWHPSSGCVGPTRDGMLQLNLPHPGVVRLTMELRFSAMADALINPDASSSASGSCNA